MIVRVQLLADDGADLGWRDITVDPANADWLDDVTEAADLMVDAQLNATGGPTPAAGPATDCWNARHGRQQCAKACGPNGSCVLR